MADLYALYRLALEEAWIQTVASMNIFGWHCVYTALDVRLPVALGAHFADEAPTTDT
jgi:hypothetical protein